MAINPNEIFYRGYNPATLLAGYEDTWAQQSWKETPVARIPLVPVQELKDAKSAAAAPRYPDVYYQNPATLHSGYEDTWVQKSWKEIPAKETVLVQEHKEEKTRAPMRYSDYYNGNWIKARKGAMARNMTLQEKKVGVNGSWFVQRRPSVTRAASFQERTSDVGELEKKGIIELRMPLCCEGCVEKVQRKLKSLKGVASVECSQEKQKVVVRGSAEPEDVLKRAKAALPRSTFWVEEI